MLATISISLIAFLLGRVIGFLGALLALSFTYGIKKNYDDWNDRFPNEEEKINDHLI